MEKQIIDGIIFRRYPDSKRTAHKNYFISSAQKSTGFKTILLHRYIWTKHNGEIPKGYHIHHKDRNTINNEISNLELVQSNEHYKYHANLPENIKKHSKNAIKNNAKMQEATKIWRNSEEGKKWHSEHTRTSLNKPIQVTCHECQKSETRYATSAKFCSKKCQGRFQARKWRKEHPDYYKRPKTSR